MYTVSSTFYHSKPYINNLTFVYRATEHSNSRQTTIPSVSLAAYLTALFAPPTPKLLSLSKLSDPQSECPKAGEGMNHVSSSLLWGWPQGEGGAARYETSHV